MFSSRSMSKWHFENTFWKKYSFAPAVVSARRRPAAVSEGGIGLTSLTLHVPQRTNSTAISDHVSTTRSSRVHGCMTFIMWCDIFTDPKNRFLLRGWNVSCLWNKLRYLLWTATCCGKNCLDLFECSGGCFINWFQVSIINLTVVINRQVQETLGG